MERIIKGIALGIAVLALATNAGAATNQFGVKAGVAIQELGGESMINTSLEYRQPLYSVAQAGTYKQIEIFHARLFIDAGILDPAPWQLDLDELRASVGFGFGLSHPLPISLNFGFPIRTGEGDREEVFSFSIVNITF